MMSRLTSTRGWLVVGIVGSVVILLLGYFALIAPQRSKASSIGMEAAEARGTTQGLQAKAIALKKQSDELPAKQAEQPHIFSYALRNREAIWMGVPASYNLAELVTLPMRQLLGQGMFFIAPLLAGTREIGVLYADSRLSGRALKHEQFVAFQRFTQLTGRCLEALGKR